MFRNENVLTLDPLELLKALKHDEGFGAELQGVVLTKCMVYLALDKSKSKPATNDTLLEGGNTVGDLVGSAGGNIFIRIELPAGAMIEIMELWNSV